MIKIHVSEFAAAGTPDLICCVAGHFIAFEVKGPKEEPTELQAYTIERIQSAGGTSAVVHTPEEAIAIVSRIVRH